MHTLRVMGEAVRSPVHVAAVLLAVIPILFAVVVM